MQLATFSLDEFHNLVVTFPIFIVPLDHCPFPLYELETVPVPIDDQDDHASSFLEVIVKNLTLQPQMWHTFRFVLLNCLDVR